MSHLGHVSWDDDKDSEHRAKRGKGFEDIVPLLNQQQVVMKNPGYPGQFKIVGSLEGKFWTLIVEKMEDDYGDFLWCSNFRETTKDERREYERQVAR